MTCSRRFRTIPALLLGIILLVSCTAPFTPAVKEEKHAAPAPTVLQKGHSIEEGYIPVSGGNVWYRITGRDKKGTPLLVIHGGPGASHEYLRVLEHLSNERPVVLYDQLGCGRSDKPTDKALWNLPRYVAELQQVRDALKLSEVHLLGQSWGSMLATDYVLQHPAGVKSVVMSGAVLSTKRFAADQRAWIDKLPLKVRSAIDRAHATGSFSSKEYKKATDIYYRKHVCQLSPWPDELNKTMEDFNSSIYEYMWGPSEFHPTGTLKDYDRIADLGKISVPVLLTCGDHDEVPPKTCAFYSRHFPVVETVAFGDASHEHHLERPDSYLLIVRRFLRKAERR